MERKLMIGVFGTGASVMVLELLGTRIVAPYMGASMYVWTSMIGVILGCLALGYYWGGEWARKGASMDHLGFVVSGSAAWVIVMALFKDIALELLVFAVTSQYIQSVLAALILFAVPAVLLGLVSPMAAQIVIKKAENSGEWVGRLYAISTLGSIAGTFLTGFWLVPNFGHLRVLYMVAVVLSFIGWWWASSKKVWQIVFILVALIGLTRLWSVGNTFKGLLLDRDTAYFRVMVRADDDGGRTMWIDGTRSSKAFLGQPLKLGFGYYPFYDLMFWNKRDLKQVLMIGGAGLGYPRYLVSKYPEIKITVVEIDPTLTEIAKSHFGYKDHENIKLIHQDGRVFLNNNTTKYDAVLLDVFSGYTVPPHMVSVEAIEQIKKSLVPDGVVVMNMIGSANGDKGILARSVTSGFKKVFGEVRVFGVGNGNPDQVQNLALVAGERLGAGTGLIASEKRMLAFEMELKESEPFWDDWNPTDFYSVVSMTK